MAIDRAALVARHRIILTRPDAMSPLSVGNGEFAFTADITGLQTFSEFHSQGTPGDQASFSMPIATQSQWGWHTMPNPEDYQLEDALSGYETARGPVTYPDGYEVIAARRGQGDHAAGAWLYNNPQRLDLGQVGLDLRHAGPDATPAQIGDLSATEQTLDLWQALLSSSFSFGGEPVQVLTVAHPTRSLIAVRIESPLIRDGRLAVKIAFPYASTGWATAADWSAPERHQTAYVLSATGCTFTRTLDADRYYCALVWTEGGAFSQTGTHQYRLAAPGMDTLEFSMAFAPAPIGAVLPSFDETREAAAAHWATFWQSGGAVDLSDSSNPRAPELERRIVLSQYLTAVHCAGSLPPQETGLVCNSWHGKFHLEMHWWHAAHFALWGRPHLLERSLPWYQRILPVAQATARRQGYRGARWPKQVGPDGRETPSTVGAFLIWQQPHPIYYAELLWRVQRDQETLERYRELVFETAEFMASFAQRSPELDDQRYILAPPLIPAQESYGDIRTTVVNPTFELVYWYWGLETAQRWRERLGLPRDPAWECVKNGLSAPIPRDGIYPAIETAPYTIRTDHPSMLMALGFLPQTPLIDPEIMRRTLESVRQDWDWPSTWGWDYPVLAMCAARLGDASGAIDGLLMPMPKNTYLPNGHNMQVPSRLPLYLPGNGGLLAAVALMVAGWDGGPARAAPGFPDDGTWVVQAEGLAPLP
ncbi:MAG TPA: hypothetical protein VGD69_18475 [Herpetosiphonaceae bacterium]